MESKSTCGIALLASKQWHDTTRAPRGAEGLLVVGFRSAKASLSRSERRQRITLAGAIAYLAIVLFSTLAYAQDLSSTGDLLKPVIPAEGEPLAIDLPSAWSLAGVQNPVINQAWQAVRLASALELKAKVLWLPNLNAGTNYRDHNGVLQAPTGQIRDLSSQSLYLGGGANAVGAGTVQVPMVQIFTQLSEAIFEPLAARQRTSARQYDAVAANNNILLETTLSYLNLAAAEGRLSAWQQSYRESQHVVDSTMAFAATGQGRRGDADRANSEHFLFAARVLQAEEAAFIASAQLSRLLNLDPSTRLRTPGGALQTIDLVPLGPPLSAYLEMAVRTRPELSADAMAIAESQTRLREEQVRPFLPLISAGYSAGGFGGTGNYVATTPPFTALNARTDLDVYMVWSLQNGGLGNLATQKRRQAEVGRVIANRAATVNRVRSEVAEAYGMSLARRRQVAVAQRQLQEAEVAFQEDFRRQRGGKGSPSNCSIACVCSPMRDKH